MTISKTNITFLLVTTCTILLTSCSGIKKEAKYPSGLDRSATGEDIYGEKESVFGSEGLKLFGGKDKKDNSSSGIGVNSYLWRASLDTVSFMPLASADPFGGVILTDWYTSEEVQSERFKINVFILDKQLRSDGVRVRIFKQIYKGGSWRDSAPAENTARQLEDTILTRARQLRVAQLSD